MVAAVAGFRGSDSAVVTGSRLHVCKMLRGWTGGQSWVEWFSAKQVLTGCAVKREALTQQMTFLLSPDVQPSLLRPPPPPHNHHPPCSHAAQLLRPMRVLWLRPRRDRRMSIYDAIGVRVSSIAERLYSL